MPRQEHARETYERIVGLLANPSQYPPAILEEIQRQERRYRQAYEREEHERRNTNLAETIREYKTELHTPELLTRTWQNVWDVLGFRTEKEVSVPPVTINQDQIAAIESQGRMLIYLPEQFSDPKTFPVLAADGIYGLREERSNPIYRRGYSTDGGKRHHTDFSFTNTYNQFGWMHTEGQEETPLIGAEPQAMLEQLRSGERQGMTLNSYLTSLYFAQLLGVTLDRSKNGFSFIGSRNALIGSVSKDGVPCVESIQIGLEEAPSVHIIGSNYLESLERQYIGMRTVQRVQ